MIAHSPLIRKLAVRLEPVSGPFFGILALILGAALAVASRFLPSPLLIPAAVIGLAVVIFFIRHIEWGLAVLIFTIYTNLSFVLIYYHGIPSITKAFVPFLLGLVALRWALQGKRPTGWQEPVVFIALYAMVGLTSLLHAVDFSIALDQFIDFVKDVLIAVTILLILQKASHLRLVVWAMILVGLFLGSISVYQYLTGTFDNPYWGFGQTVYAQIIGETNDYRLGGPIGDSNFFAQMMLAFVPLSFDRLLHEKNMIGKLVAGWGLGATVLTVVFTFSRGAFLAMSVMIIIMAFFLYPRPRVIIPLLIISLVVSQFAPENYFDRIGTLFDGLPFGSQEQQVSEASFRGRTSEGKVAVLMFKDHPLLGVGIGNYNVYYQEYARPLGLEKRREDRSAHSLYLEMAAEQGVAGLTAFAIMLIYTFRGAIISARKARAAQRQDTARVMVAFYIALLGYLIAAIFLHDAYPRFFWALVGINMTFRQLARVADNSADSVALHRLSVQGT